jgi:hypothetical protein
MYMLAALDEAVSTLQEMTETYSTTIIYVANYVVS